MALLPDNMSDADRERLLGCVSAQTMQMNFMWGREVGEALADRWAYRQFHWSESMRVGLYNAVSAAKPSPGYSLSFGLARSAME